MTEPSYHPETPPPNAGGEQRVEGLVVRIDAKQCQVEVGSEVLTATLRGRLFENRGQQTQPLAVGDRVRLLRSADGGAIEERLPRRTVLARSSAGEGKREQVLAANVDLVLVVASLTEPALRANLVDRILAGAARQHMASALVITKVDLVEDHELTPWRQLYGDLGYSVLATSIVDGRGLDALRALLRGRIAVVCGLSGVGKSSLLNALDGGLQLRVGGVSERSREGKHTTTHASLLRLQSGGHVVDTPGIRNFGLFDLTRGEVAGCFVELREAAGACRFGNCSHRVEAGCAVLPLVASGQITQSRYASYLELWAEAAG
jgi:ribosome biogenesis GTPase